MIKVFVDSGSSIKNNEIQKYGVEILPLKILLNEKEYSDGVDLDMNVFYHELIDNKQFPKTSLPSLDSAKRRVKEYIDKGYDVIVLTISSGISGTYQALKMLFSDYSNVLVVDSQTAVGGMKILVNEINKHLDKSLNEVEIILNNLIPRIRVFAVPETLTYLHRGGRLSTISFAAGQVLRIKPIIELRKKVSVSDKTMGLTRAKRILVSKLNNCDLNYPIVPSYTYKDDNLNDIISMCDKQYQDIMIEKDNLDPAIACHWGPNAFGFIFVAKEK